MKFHGHANMQQNQLQNASLETLVTFPASPVVGQIAFINRVVYICVENNPLPAIWVPLTNEITAYTHTQGMASATWNIVHGLNTTSVEIQVFGADNKAVIPAEIEVTGNNTATISFGTVFAGRATVVSGHFDGNVKPTYAYTHYQSESSATWTITHNLGYNPIIRVFIGTNEVLPSSVSHTNTNTAVITFATPQVGYARLI